MKWTTGAILLYYFFNNNECLIDCCQLLFGHISMSNGLCHRWNCAGVSPHVGQIHFCTRFCLSVVVFNFFFVQFRNSNVVPSLMNERTMKNRNRANERTSQRGWQNTNSNKQWNTEENVWLRLLFIHRARDDERWHARGKQCQPHSTSGSFWTFISKRASIFHAYIASNDRCRHHRSTASAVSVVVYGCTKITLLFLRLRIRRPTVRYKPNTIVIDKWAQNGKKAAKEKHTAEKNRVKWIHGGSQRNGYIQKIVCIATSSETKQEKNYTWSHEPRALALFHLYATPCHRKQRFDRACHTVYDTYLTFTWTVYFSFVCLFQFHSLFTVMSEQHTCTYRSTLDAYERYHNRKYFQSFFFRLPFFAAVHFDSFRYFRVVWCQRQSLVVQFMRYSHYINRWEQKTERMKRQQKLNEQKQTKTKK